MKDSRNFSQVENPVQPRLIMASHRARLAEIVLLKFSKHDDFVSHVLSKTLREL